MNKPTIKTLATQLKLSVATISKALRDSHEISPETKRRVQALAAQLGYVPDAYASSLRRRDSKTIGVVIPEVVDSFFAQAINGIESVAQEKGYHVLIYLTHESVEKEKTILKDFESGRVDGVLMSVSRETGCSDHIRQLISRVPLVFFDRVCDDIDTACVTTDDYDSTYHATEHLIRKGCRQVLFLSFSELLSISSKRLDGYKTALLKNGLPVAARNVLSFQNHPKADLQLLKKKLKNARQADGILASVEKLAITVYQACADLRLRIPEDIQVISFSNSDSAAFLNPPLTTITQPAFEMGKTAAALLVRSLGKKKPALHKQEVVIASDLVLRRSTR